MPVASGASRDAQIIMIQDPASSELHLSYIIKCISQVILALAVLPGMHAVLSYQVNQVHRASSPSPARLPLLHQVVPHRMNTAGNGARSHGARAKAGA